MKFAARLELVKIKEQGKMDEEKIKPNAAAAALVVLIVGIILLTGFTRTRPRAALPVRAAAPQPEIPGPILHAPGATNLAPGLNTNPSNDPTPAVFQYATGTDPFNGETGEGSGPASTQRTAALHDTYTQTATAKQPKADATPIPTGKLKAIHAEPAQVKG